jgi:hypothetical protein
MRDIIGSNKAAKEGSRLYGKRFDIIAYDQNIPKPRKIEIDRKETKC